MRVRFSREADTDLAAIRAYISLDNPRRAEIFTRQLVTACLAIADAPLGWTLIPRYERLGLRRKSYRQYLIFYRVHPDRIEIVRVLHGRRDVDRILSEPDP